MRPEQWKSHRIIAQYGLKLSENFDSCYLQECNFLNQISILTLILKKRF